MFKRILIIVFLQAAIGYLVLPEMICQRYRRTGAVHKALCSVSW